MSAPVGYTLKHPISVTINPGKSDERKEEIVEVTLRRLKGKDLREVDKASGDVDGTLRLIARATGLTIAQCDELDAEDVGELGTLVEGFMPPGRKTGQTSSAT